MGSELARHLLAAATRLSLTRAASARAPTPAAWLDLLARPPSRAVSEVVFTWSRRERCRISRAGAEGLVHGAAPGMIHVDMSTISPRLRETLPGAGRARRRHAGCAVSGGVARQDGISHYCGGDQAVSKRARPLLACLGKSIFTWPVGNGAGDKLATRSPSSLPAGRRRGVAVCTRAGANPAGARGDHDGYGATACSMCWARKW